MTEWQPIETAPRGVQLIIYWPPVPPKRPGGSWLSEMIKVDLAGGTPFRRPTHWMPLPPVPSTSQPQEA